jgi:hypothetical protein
MDIREQISRLTQDQLMEALRQLAEDLPDETAKAIQRAIYKYPYRI